MNYKYCKHHDIDTIENPENFTIEMDNFTIRKGIKYGPYKRIRCVLCKKNYYLNWLNRNKKKEKERLRIYNAKPENKLKRKKKTLNWLKNNKKTNLATQRKYYNDKLKDNINYKIKGALRSRIWTVLKKQKKSNSTLKLTGCSLEELRKHLENKFEDGMDWNNYGVWHIDHIIPCAQFDLSYPEQQKICFHYTNLQPMWGENNVKKGSRLI
jgi:hypothetical protein